MEKIDLEKKIILITGAAGFIGSNLVLKLLQMNLSTHIIGIDNMNDYYDVSIKEYRLKQIEEVEKQHVTAKWTFIKGSIANKEMVVNF